ncbi:MAG: hypothetical protein KME54_23265 [Tolypothrix brevis GSE-NOS-MK-07-07A]|jgi:hypothetical protein|nr:hypothetical protein [Tolypothrix brevis GSE-NOS-MK-07-07A]
MECQGGQLACENAKKAKIKVIIDDKVENLEFDAPVCVKKQKTGDPISNDIKCWRFWGTTDGVIIFQHYACGENASYQPHRSLKYNGAWLIVDGIRQVGEGYYYWNRVDEVNQSHARFLSVVTNLDNQQGNVSGNCDACLITGCQIIATTEGGVTYKSKKGVKCTFEIACDNDCPPGHMRCETSSYPGYCCIPCAEIKSEITSITASVKRINNG